MSIRTELNSVNLNRLAVDLGDIPMGELLTALIKAMTATEATPSITSNVITLAAVPTAVLQVNGTVGGTTGVKKLRIGVVGTDVPATGECIWQPGTAKIALAVVDAVTTCPVTYVVATDKASVMESGV